MKTGNTDSFDRLKTGTTIISDHVKTGNTVITNGMKTGTESKNYISQETKAVTEMKRFTLTKHER